MKPENSFAWVPLAGHALHHVGIYFDAVRIGGARAEEVADILAELTDDAAGPVVHDVVGARNMHFLLRPGTAASYRWPPGIRVLRRGDRGAAFVGVPALGGDTWPLVWRSAPSPEVPHVDGELLHRALCGLLGWEPR